MSKSINSSVKWGFRGLVVAAIAFTSQANAQQAPTSGSAKGAQSTDLGEVVVTAQRRTERLQDVPASISAIGGDALEAGKLGTVSEAIARVPNVQVDMPFGQGGPPNFTIRGIASTDYSQNQSKPIVVYFDESARNFQVFDVQPLYDIERVEVLRGPQGTLYGRNATGGAVNIIPRAPQFDNSGSVTLGYGNFNTRHAEGVANLQLIPDRFAARVSVYYINDNGIFKNIAPGVGDGMETDIFAFRAALRFKVSDTLEATARFSHVHSSGRNYQVYARNITIPSTFWYPGLSSIPGLDRSNVSFYENDNNYPGQHLVASDGINLQVKWQPSEHYALHSITSYDSGRMLDDADASGLPARIAVGVAHSSNWQFSQEFRLSSSYEGPLNWQAGVQYYKDYASFGTRIETLTDPRCGVFCDFGFGLGGTGIIFGNQLHQRRSGESGYVRADYKVATDLTLHGGIRFSHDKVAYYDYYSNIGDTAVPDAIPRIDHISNGETFNNTSVETGIDWKLRPNFMLYGSYKEGYRTGAINGGAQASDAEVTIAEPETSKAFEVGLKSELFDRMMTFNAALSHTKYKHQQIINSTDGLVYQLLSMPDAKVDALEIETEIRPVNRITLGVSMGLIDAKYEGNKPGILADGKRLANTPKFTTTLGLSADLVDVEAGKLTGRVGANYASKRYFEYLNLESIAQDPRWVADLGLAWNAPRYSVNAVVKNVFDKHYFTSGVPFQFVGYDYMQRGEPRRFSVDATYRF